jgi:pyruvate dehydrogenase (quinone)/pyruvate oxidase
MAGKVPLRQIRGGRGFTIQDPADCGPILDKAFAAPGPVIVEALVDPNEPPFPAKITTDQAMKFAEALVRGTPGRFEIVKTAIDDRIRELV